LVFAVHSFRVVTNVCHSVPMISASFPRRYCGPERKIGSVARQASGCITSIGMSPVEMGSG
jgi:hypothetical protein